jgi:hypothetical protein
MPVFYDGCRESMESRPKQGQGAAAGGIVQNGGWTLGLNDQKTVIGQCCMICVLITTF